MAILRTLIPLVVLAAAILLLACQPAGKKQRQKDRDAADGASSRTGKEAYAQERAQMVDDQLRRRDIVDERVLGAMGRVPRHEFVAEDLAPMAYTDGPLPIGYDQTISQPYIVALMTQLVRPEPGDRALDVGTGSGYQAAVLAKLVEKVYSIEIIEPLADEAAARLARLGITNVVVKAGDGYRGWPEHAPFDVIILAAAPTEIPEPLIEQLAPGGRLVLPVGDLHQELVLVEKDEDGAVRRRRGIPVRFVPMTGEAERQGDASRERRR
ncbi:MAG: protein-L-isoaspartate(D-aspartate) O-methyltransferase [Candidatus Latescibacteria bacterium]|nr:protein-L-isoaspartate(D-aspartate) O-methyltransferase [Candidatus Latescibacterota bacterium]